MEKSQYGFKKGSSTEAAVLNLVDKIQEALKNEEHAMVENKYFLRVLRLFGNKISVRIFKF